MAGEGKGGGWNSRGSSKIKVGATVGLSLPDGPGKTECVIGGRSIGNGFYAQTL